MGRDEYDQGESERSTRSMRQSMQKTERLDQPETSQGEPVRPEWRSSRSRPRRSTALPSSRQEFVLWLQHGGWRTLLIVAGVVAVAMLLLILIRPRQPLQTGKATPEPAESINAQIPQTQNQNSLTPLPSVTAAPSAAAQAQGVKFKVINTGSEGLFLRADPNTDKPAIKTLPDGTIVTIIGDDSVEQDFTWKHVRDPDGTEGSAAAEWLQRVE